jgi:outer membrane protein TolC
MRSRQPNHTWRESSAHVAPANRIGGLRLNRCHRWYEHTFTRVPVFLRQRNQISFEARMLPLLTKAPRRQRFSGRRRRAALLCVLGVVATVTAGCQRAYYRERADHEAYRIIDEKVIDSGQDPQELLRITIDRRSRMFNPFDPDRPPMPVDDPHSHRYMHFVDGRRGYPLWHANGTTNAVESPDWWSFLPLDENGVLKLDADTSVRLALMHSPDYQRQLETLYLAALDVSSERFLFDTQFFAGAQTSYTALGPDRGPAGSSSQVSVGPFSNGRRPLALQRSFVTGADLVVGVANSVVWELSGPNTQSATTVLDFAFVQPLLRGAGRDRIMERLTLSERRLLANIRTYERYRRSFYLNITTGRGTESGVQRSGGVFGVGLGGFTGLGGGFAGLSGGGGGGGFGGVSVAQAGGFLGLLQDQLQIRNQEENVARLQESLLLLEDTLRLQLTTIPDSPTEILTQRLQIAQARNALFQANSGLLQSRTAFEASVDSFLRTLGLPPYICAKIEDPLLSQFELISETLKTRRTDASLLRQDVGALNTRMLELSVETVDPVTGLPARTIQPSVALAETVDDLGTLIDPIRELNDSLLQIDIPEITKDIARLRESLPKRVMEANRLRDIYARERDQICTLLPISSVDPSLFDVDASGELSNELTAELDKISTRLELFAPRLDELDQSIETIAADLQNILASTDASASDAPPENPLSKRLVNEIILPSQTILSDLADIILTMQLVQARARTESVVLPEVDLTPSEAYDIAQANRRDLANSRASLVDTWRLVEFNADNLESTLDFTFSGDVRNPANGNNPFDLRGSRGGMRVGLQWDAPITRLQERNTYRQSLIEFQQARRSFYQVEDSIWQVLRGQLRQLRANQINFELQRQAVRIAAEQISLNEDIRQVREVSGLPSGETAARDILFALDALLSAQNGFLNIWVNYEVVRRSLDLDLGTMELTPEGLWLDPGAIRPDTVGLPRNFDPGLNLSDGMIIQDLPAGGLNPAAPVQIDPFMPFTDEDLGAVPASPVVPGELVPPGVRAAPIPVLPPIVD